MRRGRCGGFVPGSYRPSAGLGSENVSSSSQYGDNKCPAVSGFLSCPFLNALG